MVRRWRAAAAVRTDVWPCGVLVKLRGLKSEELNGQTCQVVGVDLASERVKVQITATEKTPGKIIAVRREACAQTAFGSVRGELVELQPDEAGGYMMGDEEVA